MKKDQRLWTREELILTINLYCKTAFGSLHSRNPDVVHLSKLINRTPGAVAYKLVNLASLDPSLRERGIKGASNASKLDEKIWNEFYQDWESVSFESEKIRAKFEGKPIEELIAENKYEIQEGLEREALIRKRVNQSFFRSMILASYNGTCCITGMKRGELLIAGHIKPWSEDKENRLNPRNGIAINPLHNKAFEVGLMTIDTNFKVCISTELLQSKDQSVQGLFTQYHGREIILPSKFLPDKTFLEYHYAIKFRG